MIVDVNFEAVDVTLDDGKEEDDEENDNGNEDDDEENEYVTRK
jgi:hypothetical protein